MSLIADTLLTHLPGKRKHTPSGWISFNAPCCDDKRQRGGFIVNAGDAVSYHCFNCGFKCSWQPGRTLSQKMRKFMRELNMSDDTINKLGLEALRLNENESAEVRSIVPKFDERVLPEDSQPLNKLESAPKKLVPVLEYLANRNLYLEDYDFYWTPKVGFSNRVIIPFYYQDEIVGYTARAIGDAKPKYISEQQPGYVFNLDSQHDDRIFTIVCEGPFDAISINGCAILGAEIKDSQNWLLKQLGKELILVPDRDHEGPRTVEQAIEFRWSVSMPDWPTGIKDVNDAVVKLGKLATLWLIVSAKESNALKIRLRAKQWFRTENEEIN
jgi:hypothetical protein